MRFGVKWYKQPDYLVKSVEINLFFNFQIKGISHFGIATAKTNGFNLAEVSMAGHLKSLQG